MSIEFEESFVMKGQYIVRKLWFVTNYIGAK